MVRGSPIGTPKAPTSPWMHVVRAILTVHLTPWWQVVSGLGGSELGLQQPGGRYQSEPPSSHCWTFNAGHEQGKYYVIATDRSEAIRSEDQRSDCCSDLTFGS